MKKLLTPALLALAPVALTPALLTTVGCSQEHIDKNVATAEDLKAALADSKIKTIGLTEDIVISTGEYNAIKCGLLIDRSVTIIGKNNTIIFNNAETEPYTYTPAIEIAQKDDKAINVTLKGIKIMINSPATYSTGIKIENMTADSNIEVVDCHVWFLQNYSDALWITKNNIKGFTIKLTRTKLDGWSAIMNQTNAVQLTANECTFIGRNENKIEKQSYFYNTYATVRVSEAPFTATATPWLNRNFNRDNKFTFVRCVFESILVGQALEAKDQWSSQLPLENLSPANNKVYLNNCSVKTYLAKMPTDDKLFTCVGKNALITDATIKAYSGTQPTDWPEGLSKTATAEQYYAFYSGDNASTIILNGTKLKTHDMKDDGTWEE